MGLVDLVRQGEEGGGLLADLGHVGAEVDGLVETGLPQHLREVRRLEAFAVQLAAAQDGDPVADVHGLETEVGEVGLDVLAHDQAPEGDDAERELALVFLELTAQDRFQALGPGDGEVGLDQVVQRATDFATGGGEEAARIGLVVAYLDVGPGLVEEARGDARLRTWSYP
jgi:hypothetical protein